MTSAPEGPSNVSQGSSSAEVSFGGSVGGKTLRRELCGYKAEELQIYMFEAGHHLQDNLELRNVWGPANYM